MSALTKSILSILCFLEKSAASSKDSIVGSKATTLLFVPNAK